MVKLGRPKKWETVEQLEKDINRYFRKCEKDGIPLSITGLAIALNTTRDTLMDYQNDDVFSDTVKRAKLIIENSYEMRLISQGRTGDIFALKNFGWKDKTELEANVGVTKLEDVL